MLPSVSSSSQIVLLLFVLFFKSNFPVEGKVCDSNNGASLATNPLVWRNQPQIHVVNWVDDNLCANREECYGTPTAGSQESDRQEHYPQLCPIYIQFGDPVYFVSGPGERDYLNPIAVSQRDFQNCSLITYPYYWKVTTFPKRHTLKVPPRFLFPGDHHFFQIPFLGTPDCQTGYRVKVTVRSQDCTVPSYPSQPCFGNGYCIYTGNNLGSSEILAPGSGVANDPNCTLPDGKNYPQDLQIFTCKCRIPFKGRYCEDYDACWNHACQNGGLCNDLRRGINNREYTCTCPTNYIGKHCEYVKACFEGLCQNNGQCFYDTSRPAHFQCLCAPGYTGERCDTPMGPRQEFINNLTDTLIAEQRERDDTLKALDSMGANTTALSYPRIIIPPFVTQARESGGIGSGNYTLPAVCSNKPREGSGPDCAECGCSHSGLCIRESSGGPNTCFCPPGVSGPECRTLAGLCTYTQPCQNGGTCLERMIGNRAGIGGGSNAIAEEDDDTDSLMFPAPGETPPPPLTMSMAAINAQPPMGADDLNSRQKGGSPSSKDKLAYICVCPKGWFGYNCESRVKDGKVCSPNDCCIDGDKPMDGANLDVICARRQQGAGTPSPLDDGRSYTQPPWSDKVDYGRDKVEAERERGDQSPSQPPVIPIIEVTSPATPKVKDEARDKIVEDAKRRQDEERRRMESSCQNGGTPVDSPPPNYDPSKQIFCTCPPSFAGPYCETYMSPEMLEKLKAKTATPVPSVTILPIYTGATLNNEEITTIVESYSPSEFGYPTTGPMDSRVVTYETPPSQSPPYIAVIQPATFPAPTPTERPIQSGEVVKDDYYHLSTESTIVTYREISPITTQPTLPPPPSRVYTQTPTLPPIIAMPTEQPYIDPVDEERQREIERLKMACQNGATPFIDPSGDLNRFKCVCPINFQGRFCESYMTPDMELRVKQYYATLTTSRSPPLVITTRPTIPTLEEEEEEITYATPPRIQAQDTTYSPQTAYPPVIVWQDHRTQDTGYPIYPTAETTSSRPYVVSRDPYSRYTQLPQSGPEFTFTTTPVPNYPVTYSYSVSYGPDPGRPYHYDPYGYGQGQQQITVTPPISCQNGGTAFMATPSIVKDNCICPVPYVGKNCENYDQTMIRPQQPQVYGQSYPGETDSSGQSVLTIYDPIRGNFSSFPYIGQSVNGTQYFGPSIPGGPVSGDIAIIHNMNNGSINRYQNQEPRDRKVTIIPVPVPQQTPYNGVYISRGPEFDQMFCQNGGTPLRDPNRSPQAGPISATSRQNVFCICPEGFIGDMCETTTTGAPTAHSMEICVDNQICQNGGHCQKKTLPNGASENKCLCPIPYGGKLCENGSLGLTEPMFSDSYIKYSQPIAWDNGGKLVFQVQMVPKSDTGTIFNIINGGDDPPNSNISFHLYLKDGMINYDVTHVGTGANLAHVTANASDLIAIHCTYGVYNFQHCYRYHRNHFQPGTTRLGAVTMLVMKGNDKIYEVKTVNNNTLPPSNVDIRFGPQTDILVGAPSEQNVANDGTASTATGAAQYDGSMGLQDNFKGSILSLRINGKKIDLINDAKNGLNVINSNPGTCENVCRNGGQCVTEGWKWRCQCPDGFQGTFCERRFCNNCQNGGMCIDLRGNGQYICLCPYGWTGLNCQESLNIVVKQAFQFNGLKFGYSSYALFYPLSGLEYDFEIRFKFIVNSENSTSWTSSLLMFSGQGVTEGNFNPYFVIGIQKGYIVFRYDLDDQDPSTSQGMRELITTVPLDKSLPSHEVRFGRKYNESWLYVDNLPEVLDKASYNNNYRLDIWSGLFVGGFNTYLMQLLPKGASIFRSGFKGCIYDIYIRRDQEPDHKSILESGAQLKQSLNVLPCFRQPFCGKDSCQNNGICVDLGANYHCRCGPNYSGPKCEIPTGSQEPTTISNAIQPGGNVYIPGQAETTTSFPTTIAQEIVDEFSKNQCELIIDNSLNEAFSVNIKFAGNPNTEQIIIILNIMAENKSLYKLTFVLDFRPLINIRQGESVAIKDDVFILPLNNSVSIRNFTLSKIKSKLSINVNDVVHDLQVNITNHEIIHSLSLGLGNLNKNITNLALINTNRNFCYKTAELIIQNSVINIEDYFNCNMIEKCKD